MATILKPELSEKNEYYIPKERMLELIHFVKQYPTYVKCIKALDGYIKPPSALIIFNKDRSSFTDQTYYTVEAREYFQSKCDMIEFAVSHCDKEVQERLVDAIVLGQSYDIVNAKYGLLCSRNVWYKEYHHFFWILDKVRDK